MSDIKRVNVYRGAVHLLAHQGAELKLIDDRMMLAALAIAHEMWHLTEDLVARQPVAPVEAAKSHDIAA